MAFFDKALRQVQTDEAGAAQNQCAHQAGTSRSGRTSDTGARYPIPA